MGVVRPESQGCQIPKLTGLIQWPSGAPGSIWNASDKPGSTNHKPGSANAKPGGANDKPGSTNDMHGSAYDKPESAGDKPWSTSNHSRAVQAKPNLL